MFTVSLSRFFPRAAKATEDACLEHISKRIAKAGLLSRRMTMQYVDQGRIHVNGQKLTRNDPIVQSSDVVMMDDIFVPFVAEHQLPTDVQMIQRANKLAAAQPGKPIKAFLKLSPAIKLWMFYKKPKQIVSNYDNKKRNTVFEFLKTQHSGLENERVLSIGRLDYHAEGLILLTNNGDLKRRMESPVNRTERAYLASVKGEIPAEWKEKRHFILDGVKLEHVDMDAEPEMAELTMRGGQHWIRIKCAHAKMKLQDLLQPHGLEMMRLIRYKYGPYCLDLHQAKPGDFREIDLLHIPKPVVELKNKI